MERILAVICLYDIEGVPVLYRDMFKPSADLLGELILGVLDFLRHPASEIIPERAVHHPCERHLAECPDRPGPLGWGEEFRVCVDVGRMGVDVTAVQGFVNLRLEVTVIDLRSPVEVRQLHIDVVNYLRLGRGLGEQNRRSATERFRVEPMGWDEGDDVLKHRLLPSVIGYWCSHVC